MEMQTVWADRAGTLEPEGGAGALLVASRGGGIAVPGAMATVWLVLRGSVDVESRDGRFQVGPGRWLSLEREARPLAYASREGLAVGLALSATMQARLLQSARIALYPGSGRMPTRSARACFGLWRRAGPYLRNGRMPCDPDPARMNQILRQLAAFQHGYRMLIDRCPGRSQHRKRQVFARLQRARLYLEGHLDRPVRVAELAALSNVSVWYFTKTFHALYGEGPQACSAWLRLEQAARLLQDTRVSVGEIGAACGFENNCSFSRAFRAHFGMPPSLYRSIAASRRFLHIEATA